MSLQGIPARVVLAAELLRLDSGWWLVIVTAVAAVAAVTALIFSARSIAQLKNSSSVEASLDLLERMESTRDDRQVVRTLMRQQRAWSRASKKELRSVDAVCRAFDVLGYFDRRRLVARGFVEEFYAKPLKELFDGYLKPYVEFLQRPDKRGPTHYWELVQLRKRTEGWVHPAEATSKAGWFLIPFRKR